MKSPERAETGRGEALLLRDWVVAPPKEGTPRVVAPPKEGDQNRSFTWGGPPHGGTVEPVKEAPLADNQGRVSA